MSRPITAAIAVSAAMVAATGVALGAGAGGPAGGDCAETIAQPPLGDLARLPLTPAAVRVDAQLRYLDAAATARELDAAAGAASRLRTTLSRA